MLKSYSLYPERWNYLYFWIGEKFFHVLIKDAYFSLIIYILDILENDFDKRTYDFLIHDVNPENFFCLMKMYDYFHNYEDIKQYLSRSIYCTELFSNYL